MLLLLQVLGSKSRADDNANEDLFAGEFDTVELGIERIVNRPPLIYCQTCLKLDKRVTNRNNVPDSRLLCGYLVPSQVASGSGDDKTQTSADDKNLSTEKSDSDVSATSVPLEV